MAAWALALTLLKIALANFGWMASQVFHVAGAVGGFVFGNSLLALTAPLIEMVVKITVLAFVISNFLRPEQRRSLLRFGSSVLQSALRAFWGYSKLGVHLLVRTIYGKPIKKEEKR